MERPGSAGVSLSLARASRPYWGKSIDLHAFTSYSYASQVTSPAPLNKLLPTPSSLWEGSAAPIPGKIRVALSAE